MKPHCLVILNPSSGGGKKAEEVRALVEANPSWKLNETCCDSDPRKFALKACEEGFEVIIAAGGDGTINQVINGILSHKDNKNVTLGVLPCGSANDFGKSFGVSADLEEAASVIKAGAFKFSTLVKFEGGDRNFFANAATGGFSADIQDAMDDETKKWWGGFSYLRGALKALPEARNYKINAVIDGRTHDSEGMAVVIANGMYAGGLRLVPVANPCDDWLDVAIVLAKENSERAELFASFMVGNQLESEYARYFRCRKVELKCDPEMPFIIDGEQLGQTPLSFEVVPDALRVFSPENFSAGESIP